ncbi:MAG: hypothetical protein D6725_07735 [Planctomycetota bacterium]|nr:MAG: hypothetical protein D6725_07735 [Planctomycetota bacterium]
MTHHDPAKHDHEAIERGSVRPRSTGGARLVKRRRLHCCWVNGAAAECCCDTAGHAEGIGRALAENGGNSWQAWIVFSALLAVGGFFLLQ